MLQVNLHNSIIDKLHNSVDEQLSMWAPTEPSKVDVMHFTLSHAIISSDEGKQQFLELLQSRLHSKVTWTAGRPQREGNYDWTKLQCDIVRHFVAGKPLLQISDKLDSPFRFRAK